MPRARHAKFIDTSSKNRAISYIKLSLFIYRPVTVITNTKRVRTVVVRTGASRCPIPGGPGGLPVRVGGEVGGVETYRPSAGAIRD